MYIVNQTTQDERHPKFVKPLKMLNSSVHGVHSADNLAVSGVNTKAARFKGIGKNKK